MNIETQHPLLLVGCGKMGSAILSGLLPQIQSSACIKVVDPVGVPAQACRDGISVFKDAKELPSNLEPSIIIFAVKPQQMEKVVPNYLRFVESGAIFISIAAGTTIRFFEGILQLFKYTDTIGLSSMLSSRLPDPLTQVSPSLIKCTVVFLEGTTLSVHSK